MTAATNITNLTLALILAPLLTLSAGACTQRDGGDPHPTDRLDFPVAVTADPGGRVVWVTSGNFDLAYRGAAVLAIDVADQRFVTDSAFEVGGFAGPLSLLVRDGRAVAGYVLSRDADRLFYTTFSGPPQAPVVTCPGGRRDGAQTILRCPAEEAIDSVKIVDGADTTKLVVGPDPFGALVRLGRTPSEPDLLLTGAMIDGNVASYTLDEAGTPELVGNLDLLAGLYAFAESPTSGRVYTASKVSNTLQVLEIVPPDPSAEPTVTNPYVRLVDQIVIPDSLAGDRARDLAISLDGTRLYAAYRSPDALVVIDLAEDRSGHPAQRVMAKIPLGKDPGDIVVVPGPTAGSERVYVSCFGADRVEVIDPSAGAVIDSVRTGRGPFGMAYVDNPGLGIKRLYVANFYADSVGVIELDPGSPYYHTQVSEIR